LLPIAQSASPHFTTAGAQGTEPLGSSQVKIADEHAALSAPASARTPSKHKPLFETSVETAMASLSTAREASCALSRSVLAVAARSFVHEPMSFH